MRKLWVIHLHGRYHTYEAVIKVFELLILMWCFCSQQPTIHNTLPVLKNNTFTISSSLIIADNNLWSPVSPYEVFCPDIANLSTQNLIRILFLSQHHLFLFFSFSSFQTYHTKNTFHWMRKEFPLSLINKTSEFMLKTIRVVGYYHEDGKKRQHYVEALYIHTIF